MSDLEVTVAEQTNEVEVKTPAKRGPKPKKIEPVQVVEEVIESTPTPEIEIKVFAEEPSDAEIVQAEEPTVDPVESIPEIDEDDVIEITDESKDGMFVSYHRFKRGQTVWVAKYGAGHENGAFSTIDNVYKYRPIRLTVREVCIVDKVMYRFFKTSDIAEESHTKDSLYTCQDLCDQLNRI